MHVDIAISVHTPQTYSLSPYAVNIGTLAVFFEFGRTFVSSVS